MHIFISHSHKDAKFVRRLAGDLERAGLQVWYSEWKMKPGESLVQKIAEGILSSGYMVVVLSPNSVNSPWVEKEMSLALTHQLAKKAIRIVPILYRTCEFPSTFHALGDILYADFRRDYNTAFNTLLTGLGLSSRQRGIQLFQGNVDDLVVFPEIVQTGSIINMFTLTWLAQMLAGTSWKYDLMSESLTLHLEAPNSSSPPLLKIILTQDELRFMRSVTETLNWSYYDLIRPINGYTSVIQIFCRTSHPTMPGGLLWLIDTERRTELRQACDKFAATTTGKPLFGSPYSYPSAAIKELRKKGKA